MSGRTNTGVLEMPIVDAVITFTNIFAGCC